MIISTSIIICGNAKMTNIDDAVNDERFIKSNHISPKFAGNFDDASRILNQVIRDGITSLLLIFCLEGNVPQIRRLVKQAKESSLRLKTIIIGDFQNEFLADVILRSSTHPSEIRKHIQACISIKNQHKKQRFAEKFFVSIKIIKDRLTTSIFILLIVAISIAYFIGHINWKEFVELLAKIL